MKDEGLVAGRHRIEAFAGDVFDGAGEERPATEWTRHRGGLYDRERYRLWVTHGSRREYFECAEMDLASEAGFQLTTPRLRRWLEEEFRLAADPVAQAC